MKPTEGQISTRQAVLLSSICLAISITLSSPLFYYTTLEIKQNLFTDRLVKHKQRNIVAFIILTKICFIFLQ